MTDRQTDGQTDRHPHRLMIWPHVVGHIISRRLATGMQTNVTVILTSVIKAEGGGKVRAMLRQQLRF